MFGIIRRLLGDADSGLVVPSANPEVRDFIRHMHGVAAPYIGRRTVAIYGVSCIRLPYILGSGVPFQIGPCRFVLTAAHVLDRALALKRGIYLSPGTQGGRLVALDGCAVHKSQMPPSGSRLDDTYDVCAIRLTEQVVQQLGPDMEFVRLTEMDWNDEALPGSYYMMHGFPLSNMRVNLCRRTVRCESLPYGTITYVGDRGNWPAAEPAVYIDLDFDRTKSVDDHGRRVKTPSPRGVSGCGIWRLSRAGVQKSTWDESHIRLVAIEHRWNRRLSVLRGTRVGYPLDIARNNYRQCFHAAGG